MDIDDAATLMTLLPRPRKRSLSLSGVLPGWDMLQVDVPSRKQVETAMAILVGSGLAEVDSSWELRLTEQGGQVRRSVRGGWVGMREIAGAIGELLTGRQLSRAPLSLPREVFDPVLEDYLDEGRRMAERRSRSRPHWWWPDPFGRRPVKRSGNDRRAAE